MAPARHTFDHAIFAVRNEREEVVCTIDRRDEPDGHRIAAALSFVACMRTEDIEAAIEMGLCPMHNERGSQFCAVQGGVVEEDPRRYCTECGLHPTRDQTPPCRRCGNESDFMEPIDDEVAG